MFVQRALFKSTYLRTQCTRQQNGEIEIKSVSTERVSSHHRISFILLKQLSNATVYKVHTNIHTTRSSAIAEGPRDASCQLESCQLPHNSAETTCTTSPEQIEVMKLKLYSGPVRNKHVHSTMTRSSRFHCPISVVNKPTTDELCISPVYRRLAVAKFSKSAM